MKNFMYITLGLITILVTALAISSVITGINTTINVFGAWFIVSISSTILIINEYNISERKQRKQYYYQEEYSTKYHLL